MLKFLLAASTLATVLTLAQPARSAIIANLGVNPTSSQGDFSNAPGGGAFSDQFTFQLVGGPQFVTIGSATNVFASPADFISNWTGQLFQDFGAPGPGGGDIPVAAPFNAVACPSSPTNCQLVAGSALLNPGNYYLEFQGIGGGSSGYGGNLTTLAVPGPVLGGRLPGLVAALSGFLGWRRWREQIMAKSGANC
jgi:hypothetical protein